MCADNTKQIEYMSEFKFTIVATDVVIFALHNNKLQVLLLELQEDPFIGMWALPGGLVKPTETVHDAAQRHLLDKTGVKDAYTEQLYTFGDIDRDPRGRVISVAYITLVIKDVISPQTEPRYKSLEWYDVADLPQLAYDHKKIIEVAVERLRSKLEYTNIVQFLLPATFTLTDLQLTYEAILNRKLDKRNFRKKINSLGIIESTGEKQQGVAYRPAEIFAFNSTSIKTVNIL